ncbi:MAG TPA: hypothetical protein VHM30_07865 [Gemmatimonadaceae bacterium]|nr:hypothetical protein [Gemmatimonadaceae bacterium]
MRHPLILGSALLLAAAPLTAQNDLPPSATAPLPTSRLVVSFEVSATLVSNRLPGDWANAIPEPLMQELAADDNFAGIDLGASNGTTTGAVGNGILVRFEFSDMASYQEWDALPETQQMLAELRQVIGYGYTRTALSMRRVPNDTHHAMPTAPRRAPAPPAPQPKATERSTSRTT